MLTTDWFSLREWTGPTMGLLSSDVETLEIKLDQVCSSSSHVSINIDKVVSQIWWGQHNRSVYSRISTLSVVTCLIARLFTSFFLIKFPEGREAVPARWNCFWEDLCRLQEKPEDQQRDSECLVSHCRPFLLQNPGQGGRRKEDGRKDQNSAFWLQRRLSERSHHRTRCGCWGGPQVLGFLLYSPEWSKEQL